MLSRFSSSRTFIMTSTLLGVVALCGGLAHSLGLVPVESVDAEPRMYLASVIELLCGILLLTAAFSLRSIRPSAWRNALGAHAGALLLLAVGILLFSTAVRYAVLSTGFQVMLFLLIALNSAGLWRLRPRNPLRRAQHEMAARLY